MVIELSAVLISWIQKRVSETSRVPDEQATLFHQILGSILYLLSRTCLKNETLKELAEVSNQCMKQIVRLVKIYPNLNISLQFYDRIINQDSANEPDNIRVFRLSIMNMIYILMKY